MTHHIYHHVPRAIEGNTLYPLNELKDIYPDTYAREVKKYEGREHVTQQHISLFHGALWNDVLFFTAVNPQDLFDERRQAGGPDSGPSKYFKLDPNKLDQSKLGVFLFQTDANPKNYEPKNFTEYHYEDLEKYAQIPEATKDYFKTEFEAGEPYIKLFYRYVPHILYYGSVDVSNSEIITVN